MDQPTPAVDQESWSRVPAGDIPYDDLLADNDSHNLLEKQVA